jgi:hypothetical protein
MFYIHGGEFMRGASNLFPGHVMAAFYEVVVVTINYRLGALGKLRLPIHLLYTGFLLSRFLIFKMEMIHSSEPSVNTRTT